MIQGQGVRNDLNLGRIERERIYCIWFFYKREYVWVYSQLNADSVFMVWNNINYIII